MFKWLRRRIGNNKPPYLLEWTVEVRDNRGLHKIRFRAHPQRHQGSPIDKVFFVRINMKTFSEVKLREALNVMPAALNTLKELDDKINLLLNDWLANKFILHQ